MTQTTYPSAVPLGARPWLGPLLAAVAGAWILGAAAFASSVLGFLIGSEQSTWPARVLLAILVLGLPLGAVVGLGLLLRAMGTPRPALVALSTAVVLDGLALGALGGYGVGPLGLAVPGAVCAAVVSVSRLGRLPRERWPGAVALGLLFLASALAVTG